MQDELKPCPFCGGEAAVESESCGWRVHCIERGCDTAGPWPDDCTEAEAITAWNTRVDAHPPTTNPVDDRETPVGDHQMVEVSLTDLRTRVRAILTGENP